MSSNMGEPKPADPDSNHSQEEFEQMMEELKLESSKNTHTSIELPKNNVDSNQQSMNSELYPESSAVNNAFPLFKESFPPQTPFNYLKDTTFTPDSSEFQQPVNRNKFSDPSPVAP